MTAILPILPELLLLTLGILILTIDPFVKKNETRRPFLGWFTGVGLVVITVLSLIFARPSEPALVFGGMVRFDGLGFLFKMFFMLAAIVTTLFFFDTGRLNQRAEVLPIVDCCNAGHVPHGLGCRPGDGLSCHRDDFHTFIYPGRFSQGR